RAAGLKMCRRRAVRMYFDAIAQTDANSRSPTPARLVAVTGSRISARMSAVMKALSRLGTALKTRAKTQLAPSVAAGIDTAENTRAVGSTAVARAMPSRKAQPSNALR